MACNKQVYAISHVYNWRVSLYKAWYYILSAQLIIPKRFLSACLGLLVTIFLQEVLRVVVFPLRDLPKRPVKGGLSKQWCDNMCHSTTS